MDAVRISSTGAGVNYYPEFVARELDFFADEELHVTVDVRCNGPGVPRDVGSVAHPIARIESPPISAFAAPGTVPPEPVS